MEKLSVMFMAGETSGDTLAVELIEAMRKEGAEIEAFGAGGKKMAKSGIELSINLTEHAIVGIWEAIKHYRKFRGFFDKLVAEALERTPRVIICIDNPGFNLRFIRAIRESSLKTDWRPKIIYYISPQLWAWHESRIHQISRDVDLLLSIFPFEKEWYAQRAPNFPVEFVGHPVCDRYADLDLRAPEEIGVPPRVALLPGSRKKEVARHLKVMVDAVKDINLKPSIVFPDDSLASKAKVLVPEISDWDIHVGNLESVLMQSDAAIAASGTVTLECAWFRIPTVVLYKTSWITFLLGKFFLKVKHIAMPNILADKEVYPEFIQGNANVRNLSLQVQSLSSDICRRRNMRKDLDGIASALGGGGAAEKAAKAIRRLVEESIHV